MTKEDHKKLGITYFNKTWDYLDKPNRSNEDDLEMLHFAHASRLHWELSGAPILNLIRGEWQISRVYATLNLAASALKHATYVHDKTLENNIGDFDLVFAHECMANAYKLLGNHEAMIHHLELGYKAIDQVDKMGDKDYCKTELDNIKK